MRQFVKFDLNKLVIQYLESDRIPGDGVTLPANCMEVTGRNDGPWLGKIYDPNTDTFSVPIPPPPTKAQIETGNIKTRYEIWQIWKNVHAEAVARGLAANILTALTNRENAAWSDLTQAIQDWMSAT